MSYRWIKWCLQQEHRLLGEMFTVRSSLHLGFYKSKLRIWWCCSRTSLQHSLFFLNIAAFFFPFSFKTFLRLSSYFPPVFLWAFCTSHKPSRQKSPLTRLIFSISRLFSVFPGYFQYFHAVQSWGAPVVPWQSTHLIYSGHVSNKAWHEVIGLDRRFMGVSAGSAVAPWYFW